MINVLYLVLLALGEKLNNKRVEGKRRLACLENLAEECDKVTYFCSD